MTSSSVLIPSSALPLSSDPSVSDSSKNKPRYSLIVSTDPRDIESAQRLRHQVFASEPGFAAAATNNTDGLDADRFDEFCDHLLVREEVTGQTVGCYRMLSPAGAITAGGLYTATEFDISALDSLRPDLVEMGRACVHPDHRTGAVMGLMWAGILRYLLLTGRSWVIGCVSIPMQPSPHDVTGELVKGVRDFLMSRHLTPVSQRVTPLNPVPGLDQIDAPRRPALPPLMRGYLRMGASICGEPAYDPDFGVADFVAILGLHQANRRYLDRLSAAAPGIFPSFSDNLEAVVGAR